MNPSLTCTYDPADNKIRIRSLARLDAETYARVKAAGFSWAPRQELFVAPMWTPEREDLALELCGDIGDEDTSLVERAEERAERFEEYREKRADDAEAAHDAVASITSGIPLGQPILVGHHSEKKARKDAERIESGMRRAVKLWDTSQYWKARAAGALRHAKYKEAPAVRHRRMKGLEADHRKHIKAINDAASASGLWRTVGLTVKQAMGIANFDGSRQWGDLADGKINAEEAARNALAIHSERMTRASRWLAHIQNRIAYEGAMLEESGGPAAAKWELEVGGRILVRDEWLVILRINRSNGVVTSVTTNAPYCRVKGIEMVKDYRAPEAADVAKVKTASKLPPMVNHPGEGFISKTKAEWDRMPKDYRATRIAKATETVGAYRYRTAFISGGSFRTAQVFITDAKRVDPPAASGAPAEPVTFEREVEVVERPRRAAPEPTRFDAMREQIKSGVKVVQADQLFVTPDALAERLVSEACVEAHHSVLEPSAGTGQLVRAVAKTGASVTAVEFNVALAANLGVQCRDFLECADLGKFDRIVMNPPFAGGQDVAHVTHALSMLAPGGKLAAIMSAGVLFRADRKSVAFRKLVADRGGSIEKLPDGSFQSSGTDVRAVIVNL